MVNFMARFVAKPTIESTLKEQLSDAHAKLIHQQIIKLGLIVDLEATEGRIFTLEKRIERINFATTCKSLSTLKTSTAEALAATAKPSRKKAEK